ncbi:hypothetical protein [Caproiciproducens faecalis]|uniref:Type II secretion system protein n=1 Tax=Caproiciproducens faecalis TaxID=2820301 RepID=A0ABS7DNQ6_9FIRM|nr:hypothetical protein [Caproiciproducens faecalis]MBW7572935.1 hypothetical protein [Caproiciproducens faecalis]
MKRTSVPVNSFFVEMILVILFFAISVTVTLQLFVQANNRAHQSSDLSTAVIQAENIAEQVSALSSPDQLPEALKTAKQESGGSYRLNYNQEWKPTASDPRYTVDVTLKKSPSEGGTMVTAKIAVSRIKNGGEDSLYSLRSAKYLPQN